MHLYEKLSFRIMSGKHLLLALLLSLLVLPAFRPLDCGAGSITCLWSAELTPESCVLVLQAGGFYPGEILRKMGGEHPASLVAPDHEITLTQKTYLKGGFGLDQAVFELSHRPRPGTTYELRVANLEERDLFMVQRYDSAPDVLAYRPIQLTTAPDTVAQTLWQPRFSYVRSEIYQYGCGPSVNVNFQLRQPPRDAARHLWVRVHNPYTDEVQESILAVAEDGGFAVGHGMCVGGFQFTRSQKYTVSVASYDTVRGVRGAWTTPRKFPNPWSEDAERGE